MKINKLQLLFASISMIGFYTSCDTMDTKPFENYDEEMVWSSFQTVDAFVVNTYKNTIENFCGNSAVWECRTPNGAYCDQVGNQIDNLASELGIEVYSDYGFGRFGAQ